MDNYALEILHIGGKELMTVVRKEFEAAFFIVARTPEYVVLGDGKKNVSFCRSKNKVLDRFSLDRDLKLERKR
jgi:hypothetical protein